MPDQDDKLNLSARLERARQLREQGAAPELGRDVTDLRFKDEEGQAYDGHEIRTGSRLTIEQWRARIKASQEEPLPAWNPRRANPHAKILDDDVIDLREQAERREVPDVELPSWAGDTYHPPAFTDGNGSNHDDRARSHPACPNCGQSARVAAVDLTGDSAKLGCNNCGFVWQPTTPDRGAGLF